MPKYLSTGLLVAIIAEPLTECPNSFARSLGSRHKVVNVAVGEPSPFTTIIALLSA